MRTALLCILLASAAFAEAQKPKLAVHPLVLQGVDSKKDREDLIALLPGIVISAGKVEIASPSDVDAELKKKGQAFCAPENLFKCLSYIADHTSSVHAIRIELRRGGHPNEWEILGTVVRVDGTVQRQPDIFTFTQPESVKFLPIARTKLEEFVASLKLSQLPLAPPAIAAAPEAKAAAPTEMPLLLSPPPAPPPEPRTSGLRIASYAVGGVAVASLVTGGIFAILASSDASALKTLTAANGGAIPVSQLPNAHALDTHQSVGTVGLAVGGAAAAAAVVLFFLGDTSSQTVLAPAPSPGGAAFVLAARF